MMIVVSGGICMETGTKDLLRETRDKFVEFFGDDDKCGYVLCPASLVLLGDHTHYNEGVILSAGVNRYIAAAGRKRGDDKILLVNNFTHTLIDINEPDGKKIGSRFPEKFIVNLLAKLKERNILTCGLEIAFTSEIPDCLGIGSVAAHQIALLKLVNKIANLHLAKDDIVSLSREFEMMLIGKISNEAHHWTTLNSKMKNIVFTDLRTRVVKNININFDEYEIVVIDTNVEIPDAPKICSERIEECEISANALKQYMWGIKNLRDISDEFLKKKVWTLPKRLYQRVNYNVQERMRVEDALKSIFNNDIAEFGRTIYASHQNIAADYFLSTSQVDFLVNQAVQMPGVVAAKMISCSPKRSIFSIVNKNYTDSYLSEIKSVYFKRYGTELSVYNLKISSGVKLFKHLEEVFA
jgi:galactokinase